MYDDELIGVEKVQEQELELIIRRRQIYHSKSGRASDSHTQKMQETGRKQESFEGHTPKSAIANDSDSHVPTKSQDTIHESELSTDNASTSQQHDDTLCCTRYSILSEKLLDEHRYAALMKSVDDLEYREQLFREYGIEL